MKIVLPANTSSPRLQNFFLATLAGEQQLRVTRHLQTRHVQAGTVLYQAGQQMEWLYLPHDCLISVLAVVEQGMSLEVAQVGAEGMLGISLPLGMGISQTQAVVRIAGDISYIDSATFCAEFKKNPALQRLLYRYTANLLTQVTQIAVCSHFHLLCERLARSLLQTRGRLQSDKFHLTHEFLAHALGVRRVGVTKAASALQEKKLLSYSRGNIEILDYPGLSKVACSCYGLLQEVQVHAHAVSET